MVVIFVRKQEKCDNRKTKITQRNKKNKKTHINLNKSFKSIEINKLIEIILEQEQNKKNRWKNPGKNFIIPWVGEKW